MTPTLFLQPLIRTILLAAGVFATFEVYADWYYYVMKVVCTKDELRIVDYSAYNEEGKARAAERGAINVDTLSTWRRTPDELNVPDKPRPHIATCSIPAGKYRVVLTNAGGGYSAPYPVVNVQEISDPKRHKVVIGNLGLDRSHQYKRYEIVFSSAYPEGRIVEESGSRE